MAVYNQLEMKTIVVLLEKTLENVIQYSTTAAGLLPKSKPLRSVSTLCPELCL